MKIHQTNSQQLSMWKLAQMTQIVVFRCAQIDVLFVLGSLSVIIKTTRVTDHTISVTGHIHTNKPEKVIKLGFNWSSFRASFWCCLVFRWNGL